MELESRKPQWMLLASIDTCKQTRELVVDPEDLPWTPGTIGLTSRLPLERRECRRSAEQRAHHPAHLAHLLIDPHRLQGGVEHLGRVAADVRHMHPPVGVEPARIPGDER